MSNEKMIELFNDSDNNFEFYLAKINPERRNLAEELGW